MAGAGLLGIGQRPAACLDRVTQAARAVQHHRHFAQADVEPDARRRGAGRQPGAAHVGHDREVGPQHRGRDDQRGAKGLGVVQRQPHRHQAAERRATHRGGCGLGPRAVAGVDHRLEILDQVAAVACRTAANGRRVGRQHGAHGCVLVHALGAVGHRDDDHRCQFAGSHQALRRLVDAPLDADAAGVEDVLAVVQVEHRVALCWLAAVARRQPDLHLARQHMGRGLWRDALDLPGAQPCGRLGTAAEGALDAQVALAQLHVTVGAVFPAGVGLIRPFDLELVGQRGCAWHPFVDEAHRHGVPAAFAVSSRRRVAPPGQRRAGAT